MPFAFVTYSFAYLDRSNYSLGTAGGLTRALHITTEQAGVAKMGGYREVLKSWNVCVLAVRHALWSVGVYGFVFWLPTIVKSLSGHGIGSTGRRLFVWPFLIAGAAAFYISYRVGTGHFIESFVLLIIAGGVMYAPYGPYFAFIPEFMPQNVSGTAMGVPSARVAVRSES